MKKLIYSSLILALTGAGLLACKKENIQVVKTQELDFDNEYHVASDGRMLVFQTVADYEKIVSDTNKVNQTEFLNTLHGLKFESYLEMEKRTKSFSKEMDEYLAEILNADGVVQIGDYLYKVDQKNEQVAVLAKENSAQYADLVECNNGNKNIRFYSTNEEVLNLVEKGENSTQKCDALEYFRELRSEGNHFIDQYASGEIFYKKLGIYFSVKIKLSLDDAHNPAHTEYGRAVLEVRDYMGWAKNKCNVDLTGGFDSPTEENIFVLPPGDVLTVLGTDVIKTQTVTFYSGTKSLKGIYFFLKLKYYYEVPGYVIQYSSLSSWFGRNINSPFL